MSGWAKTRIDLQFIEGFQIQGKAATQEDYFETNADRGVFVLADGFGGTRGRQAAELVVKSVRHFLEQEAGDLDATLPFELRPYYSLAGNVLFNAISYANSKLLKMNEGKAWIHSGGASLLAGYLEGRLLALAHVGACRLHLKRDSQLKEVISPKNLLRQVNPIVDEGEGDGIPLISFGTARSLEPEITEIEIRPQDQVFFQSSGVRSTLRDQLTALNSPHGLSQIIDNANSESNASILWLGF